MVQTWRPNPHIEKRQKESGSRVAIVVLISTHPLTSPMRWYTSLLFTSLELMLGRRCFLEITDVPFIWDTHLSFVGAPKISHHHNLMSDWKRLVLPFLLGVALCTEFLCCARGEARPSLGGWSFPEFPANGDGDQSSTNILLLLSHFSHVRLCATP